MVVSEWGLTGVEVDMTSFVMSLQIYIFFQIFHLFREKSWTVKPAYSEAASKLGHSLRAKGKWKKDSNEEEWEEEWEEGSDEEEWEEE